VSSVREIQEAFAEAGITGLPGSCYDQFSDYLELLLRWNARLSLTAIREPGQIIRRHFAECAFAAQHLPVDIESLLDYGSGAGLPGIPFAICRPETRVTLAEAQGKKASFLREVVRTIGTETEVYDGRVEKMAQGRPFHAVSMRAVEKMELAIPIALRMVERYLVLLTTERSAREYGKLAPELRWLDPVRLPNSDQMILAIGGRREEAGVRG
jgi:16S rRNA (guanine527-N7)-methyltransferase